MFTFPARALLVVVLCFTVAISYRALLRLDRASITFMQQWHAERSLRACARFAAAMRNLDAATEVLAKAWPSQASHARERARRLGEELRHRYLEEASHPLPDQQGRCQLASIGIESELHLQRHPAQPTPWPNWVGAFRASPPS